MRINIKTMAKARMLHKKISISEDVNKLSLSARLLFTWIIAHADDEGRLKGDATYIKAVVVPYTKWSRKLIESYLYQMKNTGLIYYWQNNNQQYIELCKWTDYQSIRKDRFEPSKLPSYKDNKLSTKEQPDDNQKDTQSNISELSPVKFNKSEFKESEEAVADLKTTSNSGFLINPHTFEPSTAGEVAAIEVWKQLEPYNPLAFGSTYMRALKRGLHQDLFYQFASEIKQDPTIEKRGAVFNKKVDDYFNRIERNK